MDCPKRRAVASDLPEESLVEILARVPIRSLCRSKCVAKSWRDVIEDPFHRKNLPQTLQGFFSITQNTHGLHIGYASLLARSAPLHMNPSLSSMTKLPGFKRLTFLDCCNGLLVFEHKQKSLGYVVCNPTTKQWAAVPKYGPPPPSMYHTGSINYMYLVFDPAVSSHFHLVQFVLGWEEFEEEGFVVDDDDYGDGEEGNDGYVQHYNDDDDNDDDDNEDEESMPVNVYSSESGQWIHIKSGWYKHDLDRRWHHLLGSRCVVLNGMLHFIISDTYQDRIAVVDVQGVTRKIIPVPITAGTPRKRWAEPGYVAQSQGCLHYINKAADDAQLSIWVLEDYDTQKWVLKHSVSLEQFGRMSCRQSLRKGHKKDYSVVAMHPDANVVFIVQNWNRKLISYDMDHKVVNVILRTLIKCPSSTNVLVPYVPCFLVSPALTNKL